MGAFFRDILKAELHLHLEGAIWPETLLEIDPALDADEVERRYRYDDFLGFIETFKWVLGFLRSPDEYALATRHLCERLAADNVRYAEIIFAGAGIPSGASDIVLRPRVSSAFRHPFADVPTLVVMCGHQGRDGTPLPESPDTILRRAQKRVRAETGAELWALGEVEYFLGKRSAESDIYGKTERGYHASAPFVFGEGLRRRAIS